jgi:small redox-active disulfide protein 2
MISVKILGPGCTNCTKLESLTRSALNNMGLEAHVEKVTDYREIMQYRVLATPGLVINEQLVAAGRIPSVSEITTWLVNTQV